MRILRGMFTNNKGTKDERIVEAVQTFARVDAWKQKVDLAGLFRRPLPDAADTVFGAWPSTIGGEDHYGHVIWSEQLGDVLGMIKKGITIEQTIAVRARASRGEDPERERRAARARARACSPRIGGCSPSSERSS